MTLPNLRIAIIASHLLGFAAPNIRIVSVFGIPIPLPLPLPFLIFRIGALLGGIGPLVFDVSHSCALARAARTNSVAVEITSSSLP